jgi:hypothetical protein
MMKSAFVSVTEAITKSIKRGFPLFFCLFWFSGHFLLMGDVIKDPKFTHEAKNYVEIVKHGEILADEFDDEFFLVYPYRITSDDEASIYAFDPKQKTIFKFSKNLKFIRTIGRKGQGPGEISPARYYQPEIYFAPDGHLYLTDKGNGKLIVFKKDGSHVKDIKWPGGNFDAFRPVIDREGNTYLFSSGNGALDVVDKDLKVRHTFLEKKLYERFLLYEPPPRPRGINNWILPSIFNTSYDITSANKLVVYLINSSTVYVLDVEDKKIIRHFNVWPRKRLEYYKELIKKKKSGGEKEKSSYTLFLGRFFLDKDDPDFFYINGGLDLEKNVTVIYKFNLEGGLLNVLYSREPFIAYEKRNGLFYGRRSENILIFKQKENRRPGTAVEKMLK